MNKKTLKKLQSHIDNNIDFDFFVLIVITFIVIMVVEFL